MLWLSPILFALAGGVLAMDARLAEVVRAALSPAVMWGVFWLNIAGAFWRIGAVVDAFSATGRSVSPRSTARTVVVGWSLLAVLIVAPHLVVARYTLDAISLVSSVFVADGFLADIEPVIPIGTDADIVPDPARSSAAAAGGPLYHSVFNERLWDPDYLATRTKIAGDRRPGADAPFLPFNERVGERRITVLIAGGDSGPGRGGMRTDSMIVATLHTGTGKAALFSFPRNLGSVPIPEHFEDAFVEMEKELAPEPDPLDEGAVEEGTGGEGATGEDVVGEEPPEWESCNCFPDRLNKIYPHTRRWTHTYPNEVDPGMAALRDVIEGLMGVRIDYYLLVDMAAFVDIVDALGGVDVYVQRPVQSEVSPPREGDPWATVDVDVGWNHLDGSQALAYVRARKGSSDYARMQRQRCLLRAVAAKSDPLTLLRNFPGLAGALKNGVVTDMPRSFIPDFIAAAAKLDFSDIQTVGFTHAYWLEERDHLNHPIPDVEKIQTKVRRVFAGNETRAPVNALDGECGA